MTQPFTCMDEAVQWIYHSYLRAAPHLSGVYDDTARQPELTQRLLDECGNPERGFPVVLVSGSKGKGSVSRFLSGALQSSGLRVGLFTSPHLVNFTERVRCNGREVAETDFLRILSRLRRPVESVLTHLPENRYLSPIGILLVLALIYFREKQAEILVVECGRGGTRDDTNVLLNRWAVITPLMEEHLDRLGPHMQDLIRHKTGIVKGCTEQVVIARQRPDLLPLIKKSLAHQEAKVFYSSMNFQSYVTESDISGLKLQVQTEKKYYNELCLPLMGSFQADNLATALQMGELILGRPIPQERLQDLLQNIHLPGRCEVIHRNPTTVLDGAIHAQAAKHLGQIREALEGEKVVSIVGVPKDKDFEGVVRELSRFSNLVIVSQPFISHKAFPDANAALTVARRYHSASLFIQPLVEAIHYALSQGKAEILFIVGTQTFIGEAKKLYATPGFYMPPPSS